eukprot:SAG31_NODE_4480_length_3200_cov_1.900355_2_plen_217_part_00
MTIDVATIAGVVVGHLIESTVCDEEKILSEKRKMEEARQAVLAAKSSSSDDSCDESDEERMRRARDMSVEIKAMLNVNMNSNMSKSVCEQRDSGDSKKRMKSKNTSAEKLERSKRKQVDDEPKSKSSKRKKRVEKMARERLHSRIRQACTQELEIAEKNKLKYSRLRKKVAKRIAGENKEDFASIEIKFPELQDLENVLGSTFAVKGEKIRLRKHE